MPVYFIENQENKLIKIGKAKDVLSRLGQLQAETTDQLRVLATVEGYTDKERELHQHFFEYRTKGEWFYPEQPILDFIIENGIPSSIPSIRPPSDITNRMKQCTFREDEGIVNRVLEKAGPWVRFSDLIRVLLRMYAEGQIDKNDVEKWMKEKGSN